MQRPKGKGVKIVNRGDEAEVFIYDIIDPFFGIGAKQFADDLKEIGDVKTINVRINSPGGDVFDGLAIFNQLDRHKARIVVDVDGLAASIASIIAMAGDEIRMAANSMMMIHDPWTIAVGNAVELRETADTLEQIGNQLVGTYARRTGTDSEQLETWMADETWFSAEEAKEHGFADTVIEPNAVAASVKDFDLSRFKNTPKDILEPKKDAPWSRLALDRKIRLVSNQLGIKT